MPSATPARGGDAGDRRLVIAALAEFLRRRLEQLAHGAPPALGARRLVGRDGGLAEIVHGSNLNRLSVLRKQVLSIGIIERRSPSPFDRRCTGASGQMPLPQEWLVADRPRLRPHQALMGSRDARRSPAAGRQRSTWSARHDAHRPARPRRCRSRSGEPFSRHLPDRPRGPLLVQRRLRDRRADRRCRRRPDRAARPAHAAGSNVIIVTLAAGRFTDTLIDGDTAVLRSGRASRLRSRLSDSHVACET